ncbi:MAG: hypothetical protein IJ632_03500 [Muribaculaceae bacterium]|nr:hypothetical protein [Muribaculaceae bacterium]
MKRYFTFVLMLAFMAAGAGAADLVINKLPIPVEMTEDDNYRADYPYPFDRVMYSFAENSIRPLFCTTTNGKLRITIYELDFTTLYKQFTIELPAPEGNSSYRLEGLGSYSGDFDDGGCSIQATVDLFNNDDLVEVIVNYRQRDADWNMIAETTYIINENNEVLAEIDGDLGSLIDPKCTGGKVFFEGGFRLPDRVLPVVQEKGDINGDTEVGVPDVTALVGIVMGKN